MAITSSSPASRYVRGTLNTMKIQAPASYQINPGDFVYASVPTSGSSVEQAFTASAQPWGGSLQATQVNAAPNFVGVALDQRLPSDASTGQQILIATQGQFLYPCTALGSAANVGTAVAPDKDTGSNMLDQQIAVSVATGGGGGIGRVVEFAAVNATQLLVEIQSNAIFNNKAGTI